MKCPHCNKEINFISPIYRNLETYGGSGMATSECCGAAFVVCIVYKYQVTPYTGNAETDDWNNKITKPKLTEPVGFK